MTDFSAIRYFAGVTLSAENGTGMQSWNPQIDSGHGLQEFGNTTGRWESAQRRTHSALKLLVLASALVGSGFRVCKFTTCIRPSVSKFRLEVKDNMIYE